jgi:ribonuclease HI
MMYSTMSHLTRPFIRIGGGPRVAPPLLSALVQTDGSFGSPYCGNRIANVLTSSNRLSTWNQCKTVNAVSATEAEWASVAAGLEFALEHNETAICIENDNQSVMEGLLKKDRNRMEYARYYKNRIEFLTREANWVGVRWIPRKFNRADDLFYILTLVE